MNPQFDKREMFYGVERDDSLSKRSGSSRRGQPSQSKSMMSSKKSPLQKNSRYVKKYKGSNRKGPVDEPGFREGNNIIRQPK